MAELVIGLRPLAKHPLELLKSPIDDLLASRLWIPLLCYHFLVQLCTKHKEFGANSLDSLLRARYCPSSRYGRDSFVRSPFPNGAASDCDDDYYYYYYYYFPKQQQLQPYGSRHSFGTALVARYALVELLKNIMSVTVERNQTTTQQHGDTSSNSSSPCGLHGVVVNHDDDDEEDPLLLCPIYSQLKETSVVILLCFVIKERGLSSWRRNSKSRSTRQLKRRNRTLGTSKRFFPI
jgi:hypothetical protein